MSPRILVIEDGLEYSEAFARLSRGSDPPVEIIRLAGLEGARSLLRAGHIAAVFVDAVFDRIPGDELAGPLADLVARFGGDRSRALRHLAENQGFYLLDALAPELRDVPVVVAWDFSAEPGRLAALRGRIPRLFGLPDGASAAEALALLLGPR